MNMITNSISRAALPALAGIAMGILVPVAAGQRNPDTLRYKTEDGRRRSTKVIILHEGYLEVKYKKAGRDEKSLPLDRVLKVKLGGFPDAIKQGIAAEERAGKDDTGLAQTLEKAAESFALAAGQEETRDTLKAMALYRSAIATMKLALIQPTWMDKSIARFQEFLTTYPKHRDSLQSILHLGKLLRLKGDVDGALTELKKIEKLVLDENIPTLWEVRSKIEQVKVLLAAGRVPEARTTVTSANTLLAEVTGQDLLVKNQQSQSDLLKGRCDIKEKSYAAAVTYFENITTNAGTDLTRKVVGLLGKGEAFYFKGKDKGSLKSLRMAQLAFARASVLNPNIPAFSAKAAFFTGQVLTELAAKGEGAENAQKAKQYYREVIRFHPLSDWSAKARKRLEE
jgi:tetratricopeptide (TPR) repeat protein